jgi:hypothetical protein
MSLLMSRQPERPVGKELMRERLLWLLGLGLTVVGVRSNPMLLIFPMWIFTYLGRDRFRRLVRPLPASAAFIGCGMFFGLLTEIFAILNNLHLPPEERILLSPSPALDLAYGIFYYLMLILTWYALIKVFTYSRAEVFIITGIYGIMTEEVGQVFLRIFRVPVVGLLYALIVACVYGIFPMLAYMVSEKKLASAKRSNLAIRVLAAAAGLFLEWAAYGLFVLPALKRVFQAS